jgi:hypothetical protein
MTATWPAGEGTCRRENLSAVTFPFDHAHDDHRRRVSFRLSHLHKRSSVDGPLLVARLVTRPQADLLAARRDWPAIDVQTATVGAALYVDATTATNM